MFQSYTCTCSRLTKCICSPVTIDFKSPISIWKQEYIHVHTMYVMYYKNTYMYTPCMYCITSCTFCLICLAYNSRFKKNGFLLFIFILFQIWNMLFQSYSKSQSSFEDWESTKFICSPVSINFNMKTRIHVHFYIFMLKCTL